MIPRKTSLTFVEGESSRTNSGSVGYLLGKNIKVGRRLSKSYPTGKKEYIAEPANGFYLSGADNNGECWAETSSGTRYYDDPVLDFSDSMLYGCSKDLTYAELETFCNSNQYRNLNIFK